MNRIASALLPIAILSIAALSAGCSASAADIHMRARLVKPVVAPDAKLKFAASAKIHVDPWGRGGISGDATGNEWTGWMDLKEWKLHGRMDREGGVAEWPAVLLSVAGVDPKARAAGIEVQVQLADAPNDAGVVHDFKETSLSETIGFLVPHPLREHKAEFETGMQMAARHRKWAEEATGGKPVSLKHFHQVTSLWGPYDPALAKVEMATLKHIGFNVVGGADDLLRELGMKTYTASWMYGSADPEAIDKEWQGSAATIKKQLETPEGRWKLDNTTHWVLSDEIGPVYLRSVDEAKRNGWFRDYLRKQGVTEADLGKPIDAVELPAVELYPNGEEMRAGKVFPNNGPLRERKRFYYAAKFAHWWSAQRLRQGTDLLHGTLPAMKTETLPTDHGFFNAWGAPTVGMSYRLLDLFELGAQRGVDELSAEDWMGLNHMYGPSYTWTGAQTFEYFNAIVRSAALQAPAANPIMLRSLITPSDDDYLRLKAYSAVGQGSKSFFFWTYGPTFIGTENYWSDLRSEYNGLAKFNRALSKSEDVLYPAQPIRDPVAILYSVSHDIWNTGDPASFVEKRLLWHGLRHLQVQPDFLREEDMTAAKLKNYKVLYITDWCVSRKASAAIDDWVKAGGTLYLSAGAATRDEFYEPYLPPYAATVWPADAAAQMKSQVRETGTAIRYNERTDLQSLKPMATVKVGAIEMPVLGARLSLKAPAAAGAATFDDGSSAATTVSYGRGRVQALGFMPMLAYGQMAKFKPTTMEEKWPAEPRTLIATPLQLANVTPAALANVPVVETSLLNGPAGAALVLVNYTYTPIKALTVDLKIPDAFKKATSTEGKPVRMTRTKMGTRLELPLDWTDIVVLTR